MEKAKAETLKIIKSNGFNEDGFIVFYFKIENQPVVKTYDGYEFLVSRVDFIPGINNETIMLRRGICDWDCLQYEEIDDNSKNILMNTMLQQIKQIEV